MNLSKYNELGSALADAGLIIESLTQGKSYVKENDDEASVKSAFDKVIQAARKVVNAFTDTEMNSKIFESIDDKRKIIEEAIKEFDNALNEFKELPQPVYETNITRMRVLELKKTIEEVENAIRLEAKHDLDDLYDKYVNSVNGFLKYLNENTKNANNPQGVRRDVLLHQNRKIEQSENGEHKYTPNLGHS